MANPKSQRHKRPLFADNNNPIRYVGLSKPGVLCPGHTLPLQVLLDFVRLGPNTDEGWERVRNNGKEGFDTCPLCR